MYSNQREVQIIQLQQDAIQLRLVAHYASERRFAIRLIAQREWSKSLSQGLVEMAFDSDLVTVWQRGHATRIAHQGVEWRPSTG